MSTVVEEREEEEEEKEERMNAAQFVVGLGEHGG